MRLVLGSVLLSLTLVLAGCADQATMRAPGNTTLGSAAVGGLGGAAIGAATGHGTKGALVGGAIGTLGGAAVGHQMEHNRDAAMQQQYAPPAYGAPGVPPPPPPPRSY